MRKYNLLSILLIIVHLPLMALQSSSDYSVIVDGVAVPVNECKVDMHNVQKASWCEWDWTAPAMVRVVTHISTTNAGVIVRPKSKGIIPEILNDSTIQFKISQPAFLSVEFGGDRKHNLHIFANPMLSETYNPQEHRKAIMWDSGSGNNHDVFVKGAHVIYFGKGEHKAKDLVMDEQDKGVFRIPSNTTVYIASGAVLKGKILIDHAKNVRIIGHGVLDHPSRGIEITYSKNVLIDGLTILNPSHYTVYGGQSENIDIRNIKSFSCMGWSDGIDLMCCRNVTINNVFLRNSDDCIALYNHRWWFWGGTKNIEISNAVLWADVAHPVHIGIHGDDRSPKGETLRKVHVRDCDILNEDGDGVLAIRCGDNNVVKDIRFENIMVEAVEKGRMYNIQVVYNQKYNRAPGRSISDIWFRNISFSGDTSALLPDIIQDYDSLHRVTNIHFENSYRKP